MFYKTKSLAFKGIYITDSSNILMRVYGKGPNRVNEANNYLVSEFLKYETSSKAFKSLPVKSISSAVDAIVLNPLIKGPAL